MPYFNYTLHSLDPREASYWQRREFVRAWWAIGREDDHWTPPLYGWLRRELDPRRNAHLARLRAALIHVDALHRTGIQRSRTDQQEIPLTSVFERPLSAALSAIDPRRTGRTAHLGLLHLAQEDEAFDRLYYHLVETLSAEGYHRVVGPAGLSPHLGSGLLVDSWNAWPPAHTPANPPYLPELVERRLRVFQEGRLYHAVVPAAAETIPTLTVRPFDVARLAGDLLPLLAAATENPTAGFPAPDAAEAAFLLRQIGPGAAGGLVERDGAPAGFVLLAPDDAGRRRAARGGRPLWGRAWLAVAGNRPVAAGRVLFGAVAPEARRQGIGRTLWAWALTEARARGWRMLTIGPVWEPREGRSPAAELLARHGAVARQTYRLYEATF